MATQDDSILDNNQIPQDGTPDVAPVPQSSIPEEERIKLPSIEEVFSEFTAPHSFLFPRGTETFNVEDQRNMFESLQAFVKKIHTEGFHELQDSLRQRTKSGGYDVETLEDVRVALVHLWTCNSEYLAQAAELLANQSRDCELFMPATSELLD